MAHSSDFQSVLYGVRCMSPGSWGVYEAGALEPIARFNRAEDAYDHAYTLVEIKAWAASSHNIEPRTPPRFLMKDYASKQTQAALE